MVIMKICLAVFTDLFCAQPGWSSAHLIVDLQNYELVKLGLSLVFKVRCQVQVGKSQFLLKKICADNAQAYYKKYKTSLIMIQQINRWISVFYCTTLQAFAQIMFYTVNKRMKM